MIDVNIYQCSIYFAVDNKKRNKIGETIDEKVDQFLAILSGKFRFNPWRN